MRFGSRLLLFVSSCFLWHSIANVSPIPTLNRRMRLLKIKQSVWKTLVYDRIVRVLAAIATTATAGKLIWARVFKFVADALFLTHIRSCPVLLKREFPSISFLSFFIHSYKVFIGAYHILRCIKKLTKFKRLFLAF